MTKILEWIHQVVWGIPTLSLIIGVGAYLTYITGFAQFRLFPQALRSFLRQLVHPRSGGGFKALCTALAATVGTGNLAGVAGAIAIGGPGAVFWMWVCALLGMATKFAEATLAVRFRRKNADGEYVGGPMYMIEYGLGSRWKPLAVVYCFFGVVAAFGVGNATQINTVVGAVNSALNSCGWHTTFEGNLLLGMGLAMLIGSVLLGGAQRIGALAQALVPAASGLYLLLCVAALILCADRLGTAFVMIFHGAFSPQAITGGLVGSVFTAMRIGASRGAFTNEAGMGTASIAHASADVKSPAEQGLMGIMEVFLDTVVICTMTALVILSSGVAIPYGMDAGVQLTTRAFSSVLGSWVSIPIACSLCCFAVATVLGWGLYGARCAQYLFGDGCWKKFAYAQIAVIIVGAVLKTGVVWMLSEIVNALMAIPNLIALLLLSPVLTQLIKKYAGNSSPAGGTNEHFNQCKPLRALSHAQIPSHGSCGKGKRKKDLSSEYRSA